MSARLIPLALAAVLLAAGARAQTCTTSWTNAAGGLWTDAANWSDGVPDPGDTACITLAGTYTVDATADNRTVAGLVVGGASGTQTLTARYAFRVGAAGDASAVATIGANGRVELVGGTGPSPTRLRTQGTITVAGTLVLGASTGALDEAGGLLDVAPGGTLRLETPSGTPPVVGPVSGAATVRVRGLLDCAAGASTCEVAARLDVDGGTVRATSGQLTVGFRGAGGDWTDATVDAAAGASLWFRGWQGTPFRFTGTLSGAPAGVVVNVDARMEAGPGDATLAVGGTGFVVDGPAGGSTALLGSAGGRFVNTGRMVWEAGSSALDGAVLENRGTTRAVRITMQNGGRLVNRAGATLEVTDQTLGGVVENAGLIVATGGGGVTFRTTLSENGLRSLPGSELRADAGSRFTLQPPAAATFPDGVTASGTGIVQFSLLGFEHQGTVSPGTPEAPVGTLGWNAYFRPSQTAGSPRLVIDVDAGGASDLIAVQPGGGAETVRLAGVLIVRVRPGVTPAIGDTWTILTNTSAVVGQFAQVVAEGAPSGIAFVAERSADQRAVVVRAVETAPGGPVTVFPATPVGGGRRTIFLTGPGAAGLSGARLECTDCLDPVAFGTIPATLGGTPSLAEAWFDLTSPRAFGLYDLVLQAPGQPDQRIAVRVRPYISAVSGEAVVETGMRVRPPDAPGQLHNYSPYRLTSVTNGPGAVPFVTLDRPAPESVSMILSSDHSRRAYRFYNSDLAADPLAPPLLVGAVPPLGGTSFEVGLRIDPEAVLFPEQTPTGPDDPRLPFGEGQHLFVLTTSNVTIERAAAAAEEALRATAALATYLASVDAADADAVTEAVFTTLTATRLLETADGLLRETLDRLDATVATPPGLADAASSGFDSALAAAAAALRQRETAAYSDALVASPAVRAVYEDELTALGIDYYDGPLARSNSGSTGVCARYTAEYTFGSRSAGDVRDACGCDEQRLALPASAVDPNCPPPSGPADPNDKLAETDLLCEFGTVDVGGQPETRCVRYYVPRAEATEPVVYTVKFENIPTATAPAEFVTITDEIDPNLDLASLQVLATSSDSTFSYSVAGRTITFRFVGIDLPPNVTAPEGEGFVQFALRPVPGLPDGTEIRNDASIVFDFNPAIVTPEVLHEIRTVADLGVIAVAPDFIEVGQPLETVVTVANLRGDAAEEATVTIGTGGLPDVTATATLGTCTGTGPITCTLGTLEPGAVAEVLLVAPAAPVGTYTVSAVATTSAFDGFAANDSDALSVGVTPVGTEGAPGALTEPTLAAPSPNPARGAVALRFGSPDASRADVRVFDLLGREVAVVVADAPAEAGWHELTWETRSVASGVYVVRYVTEWDGGTTVRTRRVVVVR